MFKGNMLITGALDDDYSSSHLKDKILGIITHEAPYSTGEQITEV